MIFFDIHCLNIYSDKIQNKRVESTQMSSNLDSNHAFDCML